ncbi:autotransporter domain-containing protein [Herbaspirillum sp. NPDC101396]|uniref:autotransporter family protein n=1 Tax=Herbaspirillum sp. NPDC101396 TaxID=3364005 RepID=UPI00383BEC22
MTTALLLLMPASWFNPAYAVGPTITVSIGAANLQRGLAATLQATASGGTAPYTYAVTGGVLPAGLNLAAATGTITGILSTAGAYSFTLTATDSNSFTGAQAFIGTVGAGAPVTANSGATVGYGSSNNSIPASINGGTPTSLNITTGAAHGTATPSGVNTFTYTPTAGYSGTDAFSYTATNAVGTSGVATVTVTVGAPTIVIAPSTAWFATQGASYTQTLTWSGGAAPYSTITVTGLPTGLTFSTTPSSATISGTPTQVGSFSVTASATDSSTPTPIPKMQTFTLTVSAGVPVAVADSANTQANQAVTIPVTVNDSGSITSVSAGAPAHGTAVVNGLNVLYTPAANYVGADSFTYTITGPGGTSAPATVSVTVTSPGAPTSAAQTATVQAGQAITLHVGAAAANGPVTAVAIAAAPGSGTAVVSGTDIIYTAAAGFSGSVQFSYTLTNAFGTSAAIIVNITVAARSNAANDVQVKGLVAAHGQTASRFATAQLGNFSRRLESLHGDGWARSSFGLGFAQPVAPAKPLLAQWNEDEVDRVVGAPLQAGMRKVGWPLLSQASPVGTTPLAGAGKDLDALPELPNKTSSNAKQELSLWIAGTVDFGQRNANGQQEGFRFTTNGISMGADYRLSDQLTIGVGTGYSRDRSDIGENGSKSVGQSVVATVYGSFRPTPNIFVDGMLGYGALNFDSTRYVTDDGSFATGQRGGNQLFVALSSGYEFRGNSWMWSPYGKLDLASTTLGQYTETAAGNSALTYFKQSVRTSSGTLGLRTEGQYLSRVGMWTPRGRVEYRRQFSGAGEAGISYADLASSGPAYVIRSDDSFTGNWTAGIGMRLLLAGGTSFVVDYSSNLNVGQGRYSSILFGINVPLR